MSRPLPLKEKEGEKLEFKSREILREPEKIARAVVAMLNTKVGEVWVGIREAAGRNEVEPIADAELERTRLQDRLLDLIEPRPLHGEITLTVEGEDQGGPVLRVAISPQPHRRPYALLGPRGARYFWRRFDNRTVPMTRDEIGSAFPAGSPEVARAESKTARILRGARKSALDPARGRRFALVLEPEPAGDLNLHEVVESDLLADPTCSGTPRASFNYGHASYHGGARPDPIQGRRALRLGAETLSLGVLSTGGIRFEAVLDHLRGGVIDSSGRHLFGKDVLAPEALWGYTISTLRLAGLLLGRAELWDRPPSPDRLLAGIFVTGLEGYLLPPGSGFGFSWRHEIERHRYSEEVFAEEWLALLPGEVRSDPDECGRRLLRPLYWSFGWMREDDLPAIQSLGLGPSPSF